MSADASHVSSAVETIWRMESGRLIAGIMHQVRDLGVAEEVAQDALAAAR